MQLLRKSFRHTFDLAHLQFLHRWLFEDVYHWAGKIRSVQLRKGESEFANPRFIKEQAENIFKQLSGEKYLRHLAYGDVPRRLASYYGHLNTLHPFREGNGRTQRLFFRQLLAPRGLRINWEGVTAEEKIAACVASHHGDDSGLERLFERTIENRTAS